MNEMREFHSYKVQDGIEHISKYTITANSEDQQIMFASSFSLLRTLLEFLPSLGTARALAMNLYIPGYRITE